MSLSVSRLVRVSVSLSARAAARRSFGIMMTIGDSNVISGLERYRSFSSIEAVALAFGVNAPEYKAAALYFGQTPKPQTMMIGRWLRTATAGQLLGGILSPAEQSLSAFTAITSGAFTVKIDGVDKVLSAINLSGAANLNAVATIITTALSTSGVCTFNGTRFVITSATTGVSSTLGYANATTLSNLMKFTSALAAPLVPGYAAETALEAVVALCVKTPAFYGIMFAASVMPDEAANLSISTYVEALEIKRIFGVTIQDTDVLDPLVTDDLASLMKVAAYLQSFCQYSSSSPYAVASLMGRAFSVDFNANRSTITLMYKQEPGITPEELDENQADALENKRCNVFVNYVNDTSIIEYGVMSGPAYFDEIHGLDWFREALQNSCYNLLYTSKNKVPQTEAGVNQLINACASACDESVNNGLAAPGIWTQEGFGQLQKGQYLKTGYYIYAQPLALQSQADREARKAPPIQVALKLAGAIQEVDVIVDVNR